MNNAHALKEKALWLGFDQIGVCDAVPAPHLETYRAWLDRGFHGTMEYLERHLPLKESPQNMLPGVRSVVAVTLNYRRENRTAPGLPRIATYALGRDYHRVIRGKLKRLATWIEAEYAGAECRPCVDSAPIFDRDYARLAGLGWFGKNTCLIDSKRGSWFFIGLLLTTVQFEPDAPSVGGCGTCRRCIDACPTGAIVQHDGVWQVDARRCVSYLTIEHKGEIEPELATGIGDWTFGCDVCQDVCPFNEPRPSQPMRSAEATDPDLTKFRQWPRLEQLAVIPSEDWDRTSQGSPIRRAGLEGIRRNARINLHNAITGSARPKPSDSR
ncbi:MAG: tRNA epoxyqueuosine(34) reductase QueG [Fimbriimonas sp.]|nr:tRNA epoxyqueuosine(34) reductase QueG [Fimbriimonas sp.]